jgi:hypothetical protein
LRRLTTVFLMIGALGCAARQPVSTGPAPSIADVLFVAQKRVEAGDYRAADKLLADYALANKGKDEGREIAFWRALYMVDPANKNASIAQGIRALDIYLAQDSTLWYRTQAEVLRRAASALEGQRVAQVPRQIVGRDTVFVSREEEIAALRDQLAKANAEIERIKKRLANPGR